MNKTLIQAHPQDEVRMTVNDEVIQGEAAILDRIHSLTEENLSDTVLLNVGPDCSMEHSHDPEPDYPDYAVLFERRGWAHIRDFFQDIPLLEQGKTYCLWVRTSNLVYSDVSFAMFLMGAVLRRQDWKGITLNCSASTVAEQEHHFKLLCKR